MDVAPAVTSASGTNVPVVVMPPPKKVCSAPLRRRWRAALVGVFRREPSGRTRDQRHSELIQNRGVDELAEPATAIADRAKNQRSGVVFDLAGIRCRLG